MADRHVTFHDIRPTLDALVAPGATVVREVSEGAYSRSARWLVRWPDGSRAFVKSGVYPDAEHGLHLEAAVCGGLGEPFHPRLLGWHEGARAAGEASVIVLEDLAHARWGMPLEHDDVVRLATTLERVAVAVPPARVPALDPSADHICATWSRFEHDGEALLATGLVDESWLGEHVAALARLDAQVDLTGDQLVHSDLWMQNWCRLDDRGAVVVDWSGACRGNARVNDAWGECAVRAAGGQGGIVFPPAADEQAWAAWMCGRALDFAVQSGDDRRERLVETIRREAAASIDWLCEACDLPRPQLAAFARVDRAWRP